jgi:DICT domain-containing protein
VLRGRSAGFSLEAAIDRASRAGEVASGSIFAGVRRHRPEFAPQLLTRDTMLAISRAIEDECCAQAGSGVLVAAFQRDRHYRRAQARWQELARTAIAVLVFADFSEPRWRPGTPAELPLELSSPVRREWAVVCDAGAASACLVGVERPGQEQAASGPRLFEAVWTTEPDVVRLATRIGLELARPFVPGLVGIAERALGSDAGGFAGSGEPGAIDAVRRATALTNRVVGYLQPPFHPSLRKV